MSHRTGGRILNVKALARVEGEGALHVAVRDNEVLDAKLQIYEPPRFFEAFLEGRDFREPPDITARICGICPVAYQMSSCTAIESAFGVSVEGQLAELRRLLYCGEWIESHVLHIYMLHAPDFLGYPGAIEMAAEHRDLVQRGLRMKKIGNQLMELVGGRAIHPVNVRIGGFYSSPDPERMREMLPDLRWALDAAQETVDWVNTFSFPAYEGDWEFVSVVQPDRYPIMGDRIRSASGVLDIPVAEFLDHFSEEHVAHSNALHGKWDRGQYVVGPLARFANAQDQLPPGAAAAADRVDLHGEVRNPYKSIIVRAIEVVAAYEEAIRIIEDYVRPTAPAIPVRPRASVGHGVSEAPRGLLYHRYFLKDDGSIDSCDIVPPTAQNQPAIEHDLLHVVEDNLSLSDADLTHLCEQTIRNYDPCISCATHFLEIRRVDV
ncbi:MAG: Ni/Fe hydrogenase subunit alpha [Actinobacteria bacterium]|nr:Ni/Fe hydrogenase subunit alpha [Actinomycetota bacterium]